MKNKSHTIIHQLAPYVVVKPGAESMFVVRRYPFRIQLRHKLYKILPRLSHSLFELIESDKLQKNLFEIIKKGLDRELMVIQRPVANFAPKYVEFKIFIPNSEDEDSLAHHVYGFGQSFSSLHEAFDKAVGEFLERYFLSTDWYNETLLAAKNKLGYRAVSLDGSALYLPSQKKDAELVTKENIKQANLGWVRARKLFGFLKKYVPAQRVFWMYKQVPGEAYLNHPTSNGGAGAFSKRRAIINGLYELIERDSFMFHWLLKIAPKYIDESTIDTPGYTESRYFLKRYKCEAHFFDISITDIPAVMCIIVDRSTPNDPKFSFGAAAGSHKDKLFDGSYMEALVVQRHHWFTDDINRVNFKDACFFDDTKFDGTDLNNRIRFWHGTEAEKKLTFLFSGEKLSYGEFARVHEVPLRKRSLNQEYYYVRTVFKKLIALYGQAYQPYVFFVKHSLLDKLGYYVANVVVMGFYPLYLVEHRINQDIIKLEHWKDQAAKRGFDWDGDIKNKYPHPFP